MERSPIHHKSPTLLDKSLADDPIHLPKSPFWDVFRTFGRDELIALGINTAATLGISNVSESHLLLATAGPVVEKVGLFAAYAKEACDIYRTTPESERKTKKQYVVQALQAGLPSLGKDLFLHDPLYTAGMYTGLSHYPDTPVVLLSALMFTTAVGVIAAGEVAAGEIAYKRRLRSLVKKDFTLDPLIEARFVINEDDPDQVLAELAEEFLLGTTSTDSYHDLYFDSALPTYNTRVPDIRLRERTNLKERASHSTAQVVFTRVNKVRPQSATQFNYFPIEKDKLRKVLGRIPQTTSELQDLELDRFISGQEVASEVLFRRSYAHSVGRLYVSTDLVASESSTPFSVVEMKAERKKSSVQELMKVMRHIMMKYDVIQTTHNKRLMATLSTHKVT